MIVEKGTEKTRWTAGGKRERISTEKKGFDKKKKGGKSRPKRKKREARGWETGKIKKGC